MFKSSWLEVSVKKAFCKTLQNSQKTTCICASFFRKDADLQSFPWYFETFWCFMKFSFHHKWNDARLLLMSMVYTSCLTTCRTTQELGLKSCRSTIIFIIPWDPLIPHETPPPPQANRHAPITHRHGTRKPPHEPQDPLGNITKSLKPHRIIAQRPVPPSQNANPGNTGKNLLKNRKQIFLVVRYFAWKLELVPNILWMIVDLKIYFKRGAIAGFYSANFVKPFVFFLCITSKGLHLYVLIILI